MPCSISHFRLIDFLVSLPLDLNAFGSVFDRIQLWQCMTSHDSMEERFSLEGVVSSILPEDDARGRG